MKIKQNSLLIQLFYSLEGGVEETNNFGRRTYDVVGISRFQFRCRAKSPAHSY